MIFMRSLIKEKAKLMYHELPYRKEPFKIPNYDKEDKLILARRIFILICQKMEISERQALGEGQTAKLAKLRAIYSYIGRKYGLSSPTLALIMNRDHATVLHHAKKYNDYLDQKKPWYDKNLALEVKRIETYLEKRL